MIGERGSVNESRRVVGSAVVCVRLAAEMADVVSLFMLIGLSEQKAKETQKNETLSSNLKKAIEQVRPP